MTQEAEILRRRIESIINNRRQYALNRLREEMCKGEPFGLNHYGDVDALRRVTPQGLYEHYRHVLETSPVDLFVGRARGPGRGGGPGETALPACPGGASRRPRRWRSAARRRSAPWWRTSRCSRACWSGLPDGVRYPDDDYPAARGVQRHFGRVSPLQAVRQRAGTGQPGVFHVVAAGRDERRPRSLPRASRWTKYEQALGIIREQTGGRGPGDVSDAELEQTKKGLINALLSGQDSPARIMGSRLLGIINGRLRPVAGAHRASCRR